MKTVPHILLVDDDKNLSKVVEYNLSEEGYRVRAVSNAEEALEILATNEFDLVLTDIKMPGMGGMELLKRIRENKPDLPVILITAFAAIDSAVEAMKAGASDYVPKPFARDDLKMKVKNSIEKKRLIAENFRLKIELARKDGFEGIIGRSHVMREIFETVSQVAASDSTILITGASGTGKELVAKAIHNLSPRSAGPWVPVNCAAIPRELLESDLFGHVKGAFTGAVRDQIGKFELADNGTIFLDEVGDIEIQLQPKLLRVLQEREIQRIGDSKPRKVSVKVIAATQGNLEEKIKLGTFREDLYYRLNVIPVLLPPLKDRIGDTVLLADYFINKYAKGRLSWSAEALEALEKYDWPGNVRELENLVERLSVLHRGKIIEKADLPIHITSSESGGSISIEGKTLHEVEKKLVEDALKKANGNRSKAARALGIQRHVLLYRLKKYGIK